MEEERLYCMHCGARIVPGATFCRICGYPVRRSGTSVERPEPEEKQIKPEPVPVEEGAPSEPAEPRGEYPPQEEPVEEPAVEEQAEQTSVPQPQPEQPAISAPEAPPEEVPTSALLFDPSRIYYGFDRSWWGFGAGSLYDQKGNTIGHLYRRVLTMRKSIEFREADNATVSAILHKKLSSLDTMEIENGHQLNLARIKMKTQKTENLAIWLEDLQGNLMLSAEGDFEGFSFVLYDEPRNVVAEIDKAEKWKDIFVGKEGFSFKDKYAIVLQQDARCERRFILPLVIAVEEALHEEHKTK
jgi:uncharacterized protein YxjI